MKAYEARGMERRKSKQFDGTDADTEKQEQQGGAGGAEDADPFSAASQGLLRREVSRAYTEVASAGEALSDANVDALAMLLRLLEAQVKLAFGPHGCASAGYFCLRWGST